MNISMKKCKHRTCKTGSCSNVKYTILSLALYVGFLFFFLPFKKNHYYLKYVHVWQQKNWFRCLYSLVAPLHLKKIGIAKIAL